MATDPLAAKLRGITSNISLVGTDDEVKTQISLLLGIAQTNEIQTKGLDINFQKFIDAFEDGFHQGFAPRQNKGLGQYWGQGQKQRPRIRIIKETKATEADSWTNQGYYLIELQPDRTNQEESYLLFGTPKQLIAELTYWMNYHQNRAKITSGAGGASERLPFGAKGHCLVTLVFTGRTATKKIHRIEKSFRWVRVDPNTVPPQEITRLANLIKAKFDSSFSFSTGHAAFTYNSPAQGINRVWGYFNGVGDAKKLFEQLLDLQSFSADWSKLTQSTVVQPGSRFQSPGNRMRQGGVIVRVPEERPIATVRFESAYLKFPCVKDRGILVDTQGQIMDVAKFLSKYQD